MIAIPSTATTVAPASIWSLNAQPTTLRSCRSRTTVRYSQPPSTRRYVMSETHFRPSPSALKPRFSAFSQTESVVRRRHHPPAGVQPVFAHQAGRPLLADALPVQFSQLPAHPRAAVPPLVPLHYPADQLQQPRVLVQAPRRRSVFRPLVVGACACPEKGGHLGDGPCPQVGLDELARRHRVSICAKMAAAFFRISFADFSALFSLRRRAGSSSRGRPQPGNARRPVRPPSLPASIAAACSRWRQDPRRLGLRVSRVFRPAQPPRP